MTQVTIVHDRHGGITGFATIGHTLFAESGEDVVCAAISTLAQSAANALIAIARISVILKRKPGLFILFTARESGMRRHDAQIILRSFILGMNQLSMQYPQFIKIKCRMMDSGSRNIKKRRGVRHVKSRRV